MVDRIVPRTTDVDRGRVGAALGLHDAWPVMAEPFFDWAVEDRFAAGRPAWECGGARFVAAAALSALAREGAVERSVARQALRDLDIDPEKLNPM